MNHSDASQKVVTVYLDQNVLTELRPRKWIKQINPYSVLLYTLKHSNAVVSASNTTIDEILQIPRQAYVDEHVQILRAIGFYYLKPDQDQDQYLKGEDVDRFFEEYADNQKSNSVSPMDTAIRNWDRALRKHLGLEIEETYSHLVGEIFTAIRETLKQVMLPEQLLLLRPILDLDRSAVESMVQAWFEENPGFEEGSNQLERLGRKVADPDELRKLPSDRVVSTIFERIGFSEETVSHLIATNPELNSWDLKLALPFFILNIVGYRADDFRKVTEKKDRFRSSQNDYRHLCSARHSHYLVTDDTRFLDKARAIYTWAGVSTRVVSTEEFLQSCLPFAVESLLEANDS
ncbi:hypothetical protein [Saccharospirillum sp.]|uniref:hypothetical protein n=1 Tax=Saccharospirillum sp. TaxID=2033801 RepID=UPI00349FF5AD